MCEIRQVTLVWDDAPEDPMNCYVAIDDEHIEGGDWQGWDEVDDSIAYYFLSEQEFDMARLPNNGLDFQIID